ncbi:hypothetical protein M8C21_006133 [Ambrosia artemisiifolia]|uniref:Uncharacterized protein n=1 Tax=Ambrosia artemisiifolia TaxID=4212 RepID=A0AAD5G407_AMBAR|nr:hypothetical protein M8C21_006133 [Ambrosia artemisiifolia]
MVHRWTMRKLIGFHILLLQNTIVMMNTNSLESQHDIMRAVSSIVGNDEGEMKRHQWRMKRY